MLCCAVVVIVIVFASATAPASSVLGTIYLFILILYALQLHTHVARLTTQNYSNFNRVVYACVHWFRFGVCVCVCATNGALFIYGFHLPETGNGIQSIAEAPCDIHIISMPKEISFFHFSSSSCHTSSRVGVQHSMLYFFIASKGLWLYVRNIKR